jgi:hypothetical protein
MLYPEPKDWHDTAALFDMKSPYTCPGYSLGAKQTLQIGRSFSKPRI